MTYATLLLLFLLLQMLSVLPSCLLHISAMLSPCYEHKNTVDLRLHQLESKTIIRRYLF